MEHKPVTLIGFTCGDNCSVEITRGVEGAAPETVLCTARACADWQDVSALPAALRDKGVTAKFGRADQVDGAGTVMKRNAEAIVDLRVPAALKISARSSGTGTEPLPLVRGVYVLEGGSCRQPANAFVCIGNGTGLSGSATRACRATVRSRDGNTYQVTNSCENTYNGSRTAESQTITVPDATHFTLRAGGEASARRFRPCPAGETPGALQRLAR